ncbi:MAG: hypothetical protein VYC39_18340 [Myxococcota bacterium]|nr:hypothetical protein [Myxococcota bacterium]
MRLLASAFIVLAIAPASSISETLYFCAMSDGYREQCCCKPQASSGELAQISAGQCAKSIDIEGFHRVFSSERAERENRGDSTANIARESIAFPSTPSIRATFALSAERHRADKQHLRILQCTWLI